jgi:uncharacterized membrane protein
MWGREPVLILAVVQAVLGLLVAFGFNLSGEQVAAVMAVTAAVLGFVARSRVSPAVPNETEEAVHG